MTTGQRLTQWSNSNIRPMPRQSLLRMLELKDHWKIYLVVELWI